MDRMMWARIPRNAISNFTGTAVSLATGFFIMPFTVHHIGATAFGIWMLVNSVVGYMGLLDLGLSPTLVKKSAEYMERMDSEGCLALNEIVSTVFIVYVILGVLLGLTVASFALLRESIFKVPLQDLPTFRLVLIIVGAQAALSFPMSVWNGLTAGLQDFHFINGLNISSNLMRAVVTIVLLRSGHGLIALVLMGFGVAVLSWSITWIWIRRRIPQLRVRAAGFTRKRMRELVHFSGAMLIWSIAGYAVHQADRVMLGIFLPVAAITPYEVGARLSTYSRSVLHSWLSIFMPAASALSAANDHERMRQLYIRGTKYLMASYGAVAIALLGFGRPFVSLWMGRDYTEATWIMTFLVVGNFYQSQNVVAHVMLPAMNRLRVFTTIMCIYPVVTVLLGILFVHRWGAVGMAAALAATMVLIESGFVFYIVRVFELTLPKFLQLCILPMVLSSVLALGWIGVVRLWFEPTTWIHIIFDVGGCLAVYAAGFWFLGTSPRERKSLRGKIGHLWQSFVKVGSKPMLVAEDTA